MKDFDGDGLISGFRKKSVQVYFSVIVHHTNILLQKLEPYTQKGTFNVVKYLHRCTADFVNGKSADNTKTKKIDVFQKQ